MAYLISKPTRREAEASRREGLAKAGLSPRWFRGTASCAEEAHDTQRALEREGEPFNKLWEVSADSPEAKQADQDVKLKAGINPETNELLHGR